MARNKLYVRMLTLAFDQMLCKLFGRDFMQRIKRAFSTIGHLDLLVLLWSVLGVILHTFADTAWCSAEPRHSCCDIIVLF
uniref:Uncharacterized protein n=1 Tax=Anopheles funestus TaxID=62324 RepID=A0A182S2A6_ANOFN